MITARGSYCRFSKAWLFPHEAIRAAIEATLSATERLSERYPISMWHHIIQDWIYCAARRSEWIVDMKREKWRWRKMNWFEFLLQNMELIGPQFPLKPFVLIPNIIRTNLHKWFPFSASTSKLSVKTAIQETFKWLSKEANRKIYLHTTMWWKHNSPEQKAES